MITLVTGGTGLIGKAVEFCIEQAPSSDEHWIFLGSKDLNLLDEDSVDAAFKKYNPTHVLHLAALVGGLFRNIGNNLNMFMLNMRMNETLLKYCHKYNVKKCVSCLSTCIFPDKVTYPINETMVHNGPPHNSNYGYSYAKRMLDVLNRGYNEQYGCMFTSVVPTNVFGPHDNFNLQDCHVIPGLIHKVYKAKHDGGDFVVWGTGKPLRQYIYSRDLAKLMIWCVRNYDSIEPLILSVDESEEISIKDTALKIAKAFDYDADKIKFDTTKSDGQFKKTVSNQKLKSLIPDLKFTPIDEAIQVTCDWFQENYLIART